MSNDAPWLYQTHPRFFATLGEGLEEWGAAELQELDAQDIEVGFRGFHFNAEPRVLYRIVYEARLFSRVLAPLVRFDCHSAKYLYRRVADLPWDQLMTPEQTFAVQAVTANSALRHSRHAALVVKDAIADRFRETHGRRPNVDPRDPDFGLHLYVHQNKAVLSLDLAGGSLHRRGYRERSVDAPIQETLAAAMIRASGWSGSQPLLDPFCGSGTILAEAWMAACHIPAGYLRESFGLGGLPDFDKSLWKTMKQTCDGRIAVPGNIAVRGSDIDPKALEAARHNLGRLPEGRRIEWSRADVRTLSGGSDTVICTNPPYGVRLGGRDDTHELLKTFGDVLKQRFAGCRATIFFGDDTSVKTLGLKPMLKRAVRNGGLDGRMCAYELFAGPADARRKAMGQASGGLANS